MLNNVRLSLKELLGGDYVNALKECSVSLGINDEQKAGALCESKVDFLSDKTAELADRLAGQIGQKLSAGLGVRLTGAPTEAFEKASNLRAAPLCGLNCFRIGEDGRVYLIAKSEHYQTPFGHNFEGFRLIDNARGLGVLNATHNNTRGYIVRLLEREIIRTINGLDKGDDELERVLASKKPKVLNRVLNLETGSLACEAAIKMMLARFYRPDGTFGEPKYGGKTPVFLVMGDSGGGCAANYHGTTLIAQTLRGMWPELMEKAEKAGIYKAVPVKINDIEDFERKIERYNRDGYKTAGFIHEIVLMNYGGIALEEDYLRAAYECCNRYDTPVMADEIQSCMWYSGMYLFRHYRLNPDFVILGKGFPGGEYAASKVVTSAEMDTLSQFGALVTNGQQELSALSYLISMAFVERNANGIDEMGRTVEEAFGALKNRHKDKIARIEGKGHLAAIHFHSAPEAVSFVRALNDCCIDISAQAYKADCPSAALLKLPLVTRRPALDALVSRMDEALRAL